MTYDEYIQTKVKRAESFGFDTQLEFTAALFDWQKLIVKWALKQGRCALFEDCGLGKTLQQLEWARHIVHHTKGNVLILTPLAVAQQTVREGEKFGIAVHHVREQSQIKPGINITNYERLDHFNPDEFEAVVLDESSILKGFNGKTRRALNEAFGKTKYRLCCTATPAPNDFTELGQHADFLGICSPAQMLATYFINDTFDTGTWRLKGHAVEPFWRWVSTWAACVSKPSDLGGNDEGYTLPPVHEKVITVEVDHRACDVETGELFVNTAISATAFHKEQRRTMDKRVAAAAEIVNASPDSFIVWCESNDESEALESSINNAIQIQGKDSPEYKESVVSWFQGNKCICNENWFRSKLAEWNLKHTNKNTIEKTKSAGFLNQNNTPLKTEKNENYISQNIIQPTNLNTKKHKSSATNTTQPEEKNTKRIESTEINSNCTQNNITSAILKNDLHNGSENSKLHHAIIGTCLNNKVEDVPFAAQLMPITQEATEKKDCMLTTVTIAEKSEDCCAQNAILESGTSETIQNYWNERQCICGHKNGKRVLIGKPSIFGFGLNFQNCNQEIYVGMNYSFERFYQASKRIHRFGQKREIYRYIVQADTENGVMQTIQRKTCQHHQMQELMQFTRETLTSTNKLITMNESIKSESTDQWTFFNGDCVRVAKTIPDNSIGFSIFSPPFADLFTYSSDVQDMGNCDGLESFMEQFGYLIDELHRIIMPGRECAVHCCDLLATKWKDGDIEFKDFSSAIADAFRKRGWLFHSRITIWKDPVTEMQRTKAHGLLYKTLRTDSSKSRVGAAEYLLVFRKRGDNPKPITHTESDLPLDLWQKLASPVWMDIDQGNVLNGKLSKEQSDERHICPLQLDVINNALTLWSAPDDIVFSPFGGIGSEGYCSVRRGRKFIGSELKESYWKTGCEYLRAAQSESKDLFSL